LRSASLYVTMSVCLSVCSHISKTAWPNFIKFSVHVTCSLARSFSDGNAISYVRLVLWMTTCFHIMERLGRNQSEYVCFIQFTRRRQQWRGQPSSTASRIMSCQCIFHIHRFCNDFTVHQKEFP